MASSVSMLDHSILEKLPVAVFEYTYFSTGQRDFTYISPYCEKLFGLTSEELMKGEVSLFSYIHPDERASFEQQYKLWVQNAEGFVWEGRVLHPNGSVIWINAISNASKMEDGRIVWTGVLTNITSRKEAEQINRETKEQITIESESRYRDLVETLPLGIVIYQDEKLVFANAQAARLIGAASPAELLGKSAFQFVHPDNLKLSQERLRILMQGKPVPAIDQKYLRLDGKEIVLEASAHHLTFRGKPAIQIILKDNEEERKALHQKQKSETLFTQLFQYSPFGKVMLDETGKVVLVNQGFEKMFGYTQEEVLGKTLNEFIVPPDLKDEGNDLNTLISAKQVVQIESVRMRKDKTRMSVIIYGVPISQENKTIGIFGSYVDITHQKSVEEELKIRNTELDNFVYKVSHDLRAPLSSVLGLANLAAMEGNDDNLGEYIKIIGQKVMQLDHFISDVLSHSKNLKLDVKIEKIDLQNLIDSTFTDLNYLKGADEIEKKISISGEDFFSDRWRIGEIFRNLISNAIKYRDFEKTNAQITINVKTNSDRTIVIFSDNGIGISEPNQTKIFEMFYRASLQSDGSGLGLYIVKNAVDKLGGQLKVSSELGKGTMFELKLPNHTFAPDTLVNENDTKRSTD